MRAFSTLFIAIAFALSANAAAVEKRAISTPVQTCINDINATAAQLQVVATAVDAFNRNLGYAGASAIHTKEQTLETLLKKAGTSCCVTPPTTVTAEEATLVLSVVSQLVPKVTAALSAIQTKKPEFDAIFLATLLVKGDVKNLNDQTVVLDNCLLAKTPAANLPEANGYVATINSAFAAAKATYGI